MAHQVEMAMYARVPAWHRVGKVLESAPTSSVHAIQEAGLDWEVRTASLTYNTGDGIETVPDRRIVLRDSDDRYLGVVSDSYRVIQNSDAFKFYDILAESGQIKYESAGSLRYGRVVWILAEVPYNFEVVRGDE